MTTEPEIKPKHETRIHIDQKPYRSPNPTTGETLYKLGNVAANLELYREVSGNREDQPIPDDDEVIHLEIDEHFHTGPARIFTIIVNGRKKEVTTRELTFAEIASLAFDPVPSGPGIIITITYRHGPRRNREGDLLPGKKVWIKENMIFNVLPTNKS